MNFRIKKVTIATLMWVSIFSVSWSDSRQDISGTYKLIELNGSKLPAVSWHGPGKGCKQEVLSATMLVDSENRWAMLLEEHEVCANEPEKVSTRLVDSAIFTGTYKASGNAIEFYDEGLDITDHASFENDVLRYTTNGIGDFEGQTTVAVFLKSK